MVSFVLAPVSNTSWSLNGTTIAGSPIGWIGSSSIYLNVPTDVAIDRNGTVYVLDSYNGRVQRFIPGSTVATTVVSGNYGTGLNQFYGSKLSYAKIIIVLFKGI